MTAAVATEKDMFLDHFTELESSLGGDARSPLQRLRKAAFIRFRELGFPGPRDEEWRFTNLTPLRKTAYRLARAREVRVTVEQLERLAPDVRPCHRLVFVNSFHVPEMSALGSLPGGVVLGSLAAALREQPPSVEPHLGRYARFDNHPFVALNTALFQDGALVSIPANTAMDEPIHLVFVASANDKPAMSHPRNLVLVGENCKVTLVESYLGLEEAIYFTNAVTEIIAGEGAVIDHYKVQQESTRASHLATTQVYQQRGSNFQSHAITLGGGLVRNDVNAVLDAEGCECTLNGLYLGGGEQFIDNHTRIDHAKPHCASHELYKGILTGRARGVFNGKIYVHQDAQKTDAKQTNQTLLLSDDAVINTKPQLEIFADDVKCTHGATVGQLSDEAVFYLRSRGIGLEEARSLLIFAFANDIIGRVQIDPLRAQLEQALPSRMKESV